MPHLSFIDQSKFQSYEFFLGTTCPIYGQHKLNNFFFLNWITTFLFFYFFYFFIFFYFFYYLEIEIYTIHTHTLFGEGKGDLNLCQMGGRDSLPLLGQMTGGHWMHDFTNHKWRTKLNKKGMLSIEGFYYGARNLC